MKPTLLSLWLLVPCVQPCALAGQEIHRTNAESPEKKTGEYFNLTPRQMIMAQGLSYLSLPSVPGGTPARLGLDLCSVRSMQEAHEHIPLPGQRDPIILAPPPRTERVGWFMPLTIEQVQLAQAIGHWSVSPLPTMIPFQNVGEISTSAALARGYHHYLLNGAADNEGFLVEDSADPENVFFKSRRDADARYYLIYLAGQAPPGGLVAEALRGESTARSFVVLRQQPDRHRGQVIHIQGELRRVVHFPMRREVPGVPKVYQGWVTFGSAKYTYCILFTGLPPNFPPERDWGRMSLPIEFDGYFLKTLKAGDDKEKAYLCPVLVGKTVKITASRSGLGWWQIVAAIGVGLLGTIVFFSVAMWIYRRSERRYAEKIAELRGRRAGLREQPTDQTPPAASLPSIWERPAIADGSGNPPQAPRNGRENGG